MTRKDDQALADDEANSPESQPAQPVTFDAILPAAMARRAEEIGVKRVNTDLMTRFVLSVLAGAFIAFGAIFATTVMAGNVEVASADGTWAGYARLPYGVVRLLGGLAFSLGLILVVIGGAELFTGNNLIVMAWAAERSEHAIFSRTGSLRSSAILSAPL